MANTKQKPGSMPDEDANGVARAELARVLQSDAAETASWTGVNQFSPAVIGAMTHVARHAFIPERPGPGVAYANRPQPIGFGQTISQPYIVALMSELLNIKPGARMLDVGTGSGYQAAVLAEMGATVFSIERIAELADIARGQLSQAGYTNVTVKTGDGSRGWPEHAPYDGILVAAATEGDIPEALIEQLAPGGRMVVPTGPRVGPQMLRLGIKSTDSHTKGCFTQKPVLPVAFVPLICQ